MRGYFGIGIEGASKPMNVGNLIRSAHAFGASFVFTVDAAWSVRDAASDTSDAAAQLPFYRFDAIESMRLPDDCALVGVELRDDAADLPSFRHPRRAAYVLGMERGGLSARMIACCDRLVRIPTGFSLNLAAAGAILMYDRLISTRRFGERPVGSSSPAPPLPAHEFGAPVVRRPRTRRALSCAGLLLAALACGLAAGPAAAGQLGRFQDWSAHTLAEGKSKTCYMHGEPRKKQGKYKRRGEVYAQIAHRPAERRRHEVSFTAGYVFKKGSQVDVRIDGKRFRLFTDRDTAWAHDAKADRAMVRAMKKGRTMVVRGTSSRGTLTTDTYSLAGFTRAHAAIGKACGVK